ncbi:MAG: S8 family serine peptidase, partial [Bacteroidota bacterium]
MHIQTHLLTPLFMLLAFNGLFGQGLQVNVALRPDAMALQTTLEPRTEGATWRHPLIVQWQDELQLLSYEPVFPNTSARELKPWFSLTFLSQDTSRVISQLRQSQQFASIEVNRARQMHSFTNDPQLSEQYYHQRIRTESAWDSTQGGGVPVAIIDTGIDQWHPELANKLWINSAEDLNQNGRLDSADLNGIDDDGNGYIDDVIGYDFADQPLLLGGGDDLAPDPDPFDDNGHGTAVSGVIAADANNNYGGAGIAPNTRLMTLRAFTQSGVGEDDDISRAIVYAADNSARVLNLSFGDVYPSQLMQTACQYAYDRGVIIVSSAGNASGDLLAYPSGFGEVIAVSGTSYNPDTDNEFLWPL